jgi:hypothetical protein
MMKLERAFEHELADELTRNRSRLIRGCSLEKS